MNIPLLADVVVLLGVSLGVLYLSRSVRIPPVVGLLLTGVLLGPHGLALVCRVPNLFAPFFLVSTGMLLDVRVVASSPGIAAARVAAS